MLIEEFEVQENVISALSVPINSLQEADLTAQQPLRLWAETFNQAVHHKQSGGHERNGR